MGNSAVIAKNKQGEDIIVKTKESTKKCLKKIITSSEQCGIKIKKSKRSIQSLIYMVRRLTRKYNGIVLNIHKITQVLKKLKIIDFPIINDYSYLLLCALYARDVGTILIDPEEYEKIITYMFTDFCDKHGFTPMYLLMQFIPLGIYAGVYATTFKGDESFIVEWMMKEALCVYAFILDLDE